MKRLMISILTLLNFNIVAQKDQSIKTRLDARNVPTFLKSYRENSFAEFYKISKSSKVKFEVKFYEGQLQKSVTFDGNGKMLSMEKDIRPQDINSEGQHFIDVEVRENSSPSGSWEYIFNDKGIFVQKEIE